MLKKEVAALLEQQINKEFYSAYLYLDMSNYYYSKNLDGFGNWFKIQAQEGERPRYALPDLSPEQR